MWARLICFHFVWKFLFDVMVNVHWRGRLGDRVVLLNSYYFKVRKSLQQSDVDRICIGEETKKKSKNFHSNFSMLFSLRNRQICIFYIHDWLFDREKPASVMSRNRSVTHMIERNFRWSKQKKKKNRTMKTTWEYSRRNQSIELD